jgi:sugar fermentation stimulation protein A
MAAAGHRAVLFFCVQLSAAERVAIAAEIDLEYAKTLDLALRSGVEVMAWQCEFTPYSSRLLRPLPMAL